MANDSSAKKHVLIVEDDPDFAALLRSMLANAGYSVATAYNCEDALLQVHETKPDLITLDIQMPKKSGAFFYRKLRSVSKFRDIPVVVVTGVMLNDTEMEKLVRSFLESDGVPRPEAYVEKPVNAPHFLEILRVALSPGKSVSC